MRKITQEEFENRVDEAHMGNIKVLGKYKNRRTKINVQCNCGHIWDTNPEPLTKGHGCPVCAGNKKRTTDEFVTIVKKLEGKEYTVLGEYINKDTPIKMFHLDCGNEFMMAPNAFVNGQRCPFERYERSSLSNIKPYDVVKKEILDITNGEYELLGEYSGVSKKALIKHNGCGKTYKQEPTRIINENIGCPFCYRSKGEEVIKEYLQTHKFDFKEQVRIKECRNIRPLPFDFGLYQDDNLIALIEYDGVQHFQPKFGAKQFKATQRNDSIKNNFCIQNEIPLIRIKYHRTENPITFQNVITDKINKAIIDMGIPSEAY